MHFRSKSSRKIVNSASWNREGVFGISSSPRARVRILGQLLFEMLGLDPGICLWLGCGYEFLEFSASWNREGVFRISFLPRVRVRILGQLLFEMLGLDRGICLWHGRGFEFWEFNFSVASSSWADRMLGGIQEFVCGCSAGTNSGNHGLRYPATSQSFL